ncbi:E3 ubiquitin/ISG15 ligase TRIM25-like [Anabas testudineus]|uniref:E3 ubiquitin/ISG15 ligase TRIM25-like n=1 Tax=Anabas testudineus TaxID=64144 RepID=UPI000E465A3B|nr:E3 ubiquitin/ISG15 ligase TRIM25-like [Anabas testudineus]
MAHQGHQLKQGKFCCSICLDLLKDPVTIPCGHSYCMSCIKSYFDEEDCKKTYTCPLCRHMSVQRPALVKNTMLANLLEDIKKTGASADDRYAGPGEVACDKTHKSPAFKNHKLVDPTRKLKENVCSRHNEVMKIFCRTDQTCICYLCSMDEHKNHKTVSAEAERAVRQKDLKASLQNKRQKIQMREEEIKVLQREVEAIKESADKAVKDSETIVTELVRVIKEKGSELNQLIKSQQVNEVSRVKGLQKKLEEEISELKQKEAELKELSCTEDHTEFLLNYYSQSELSEADSSYIKMRPLKYFEDGIAAASQARDKLQDILNKEWNKVSLTVRAVDVLLPHEEPKIKEEFLKYSCQITLDSFTAHGMLALSDGDTTVSEKNPSVQYSNPERFTSVHQVLSRESLTGPHYWEVEWSGKGVSIAVAYKDRNRVDNSGFGYNNKSWALECYKKYYKFRHNNVTTDISGPCSSRIGVYVDHRAGTLGFYSVAGTRTPLLQVKTTFTEPLYAGVWVWLGYFGVTSSARFIELR